MKVNYLVEELRKEVEQLVAENAYLRVENNHLKSEHYVDEELQRLAAENKRWQERKMFSLEPEEVRRLQDWIGLHPVYHISFSPLPWEGGDWEISAWDEKTGEFLEIRGY